MLPTHATGWSGDKFTWLSGCPKVEPSWFAFMLMVRPEAPFSRTDLASALERVHIGNRMFFGGNLTRQPAFLELRRSLPDQSFRIAGDLGGADRLMREAIFIGTYPGLKREHLDYVVETVPHIVPESMQILITGGTGYLGSRLVRMLSQSGHRVLALPRSQRELPSQVSAVDAVIHTACCYGRAGESNREVFAVNADWPSHLLKMLSPGTLFLNTDTVLPAGLSSYAASKELFRRAGPALARAGNVRWLNLRLEHFFGPGERSDKFITRTVRSCLAREEMHLNHGEQYRDFIFIDDVVGAFDLALRLAGRRTDLGDVCAGTGTPVQIQDLVERIHRLCGSRGTLRFGAVACREEQPDGNRPTAVGIPVPLRLAASGRAARRPGASRAV